MPKFDTVNVADASLEQLLFHCEYSEIELPENPKLATVRKILNEAGCKSIRVMLVEDKPEKDPSLLGRADFSGAMEHPYDPERERWVHCNFRQDADAEANDRSPLFVAVNDTYAWVPVNRNVCIREVLYLHLLVEETRVVQEEGTARFADARRVSIQRYPGSFLGFLGYVSDGVPNLPDGTVIVAPGGTEAGAVARSMSKSMRASAVNG